MTLSGLWPHAVTLLAAFIGAGGMWRLLGAGQRASLAVSMTTISESAAKLINEMQEELDRARGAVTVAEGAARASSVESASATIAMRQLTMETDLLRREVMALTAKIHQLIGWIHDPSMTLDRLRVWAPTPPRAINGMDGTT